MSVYSDMHREDATRAVALRERIEATGDTDLMRLMEERDYLFMDSEAGKELHAEWAAEARKLVDHFTPDANHRCACDICAITHGLAAASSRHTGRKVNGPEEANRRASVDAALDLLADELMESGFEIAEEIERRRGLASRKAQDRNMA